MESKSEGGKTSDWQCIGELAVGVFERIRIQRVLALYDQGEGNAATEKGGERKADTAVEEGNERNGGEGRAHGVGKDAHRLGLRVSQVRQFALPAVDVSEVVDKRLDRLYARVLS